MGNAVIYILGTRTNPTANEQNSGKYTATQDVADHRKSAGYIATKLQSRTVGDGTKTQKYGEVKTFEWASHMKAYISQQGAAVTKIFILTHGNWEVVSGRRHDLKPIQLASHLWYECGLGEWVTVMPVKVGIVNLLACMSGSVNPSPSTPKSPTTPYAEQVVSWLKPKMPRGKGLWIRAADGLSFTTTDGKNHVALTSATSNHEIESLEREIQKAGGSMSALKANAAKYGSKIQVATGKAAKVVFKTAG